jgi:hypothetical protein
MILQASLTIAAVDGALFGGVLPSCMDPPKELERGVLPMYCGKMSCINPVDVVAVKSLAKFTSPVCASEGQLPEADVPHQM